MGKVEGTRVWTYTMQGVVPVQVASQIPVGMTLDQYFEFLVRDSVSWKDSMLRHLNGSSVRVEIIAPEEFAKLQGGRPFHLA